MPNNGSDPARTINNVLNTGRHSAMHRLLPWFVLVVVVLMLASGAYMLLKSGEGSEVRYESAPVEQGDLTVTVTATGTLEPVNQVDVGSELSGIIESVEVDFNDRVKRGQVLARLDTDRLQATFHIDAGEASIDEQSGLTGLNVCGISPAAAPQNTKSHNTLIGKPFRFLSA